jgi:hypothetical protein
VPNPIRITLAALLCLSTLHAQTENVLKDFVDKLAISTEAVPLSDRVMQDEVFGKVEPWIPTASSNLIAEALPAASRMLTKGTTGQRGAVILLLWGVARRQDRLALLKPYLPEILACLRDPTQGVVTITEYILGSLYPPPVDQVVPYLIDYINDERVDEEFRAGGIATLVWYAPNDPAVISAIAGYMKAKHGKTARAGTIRAIGLELSNSHRYSPELVNLVVNAVRNDREIRSESIEALGRCGWKAFAAANPILSEIASDEHESSEIRNAAKAAIEEILHSPQDQL